MLLVEGVLPLLSTSREFANIYLLDASYRRNVDRCFDRRARTDEVKQSSLRLVDHFREWILCGLPALAVISRTRKAVMSATQPSEGAKWTEDLQV